jgi:hypothetical protein
VAIGRPGHATVESTTKPSTGGSTLELHTAVQLCAYERRARQLSGSGLEWMGVEDEMRLWTVEVFQDKTGRQPFTIWADRLAETKFVALDAAITKVLAVRGLDLASTEWLKPLGGGLHEFRIRHSAEEIEHMFGGSRANRSRRGAVLLRVFVHFHGARVVLLLGGYDKGTDAGGGRQDREIARARKNLEGWRLQEQRRRRGSR